MTRPCIPSRPMKCGTSAHADSLATSPRIALSTGENLTCPISGRICSVACSCAPGTASRRAAQTFSVFEGANQQLNYHRLFGGQLLGQLIHHLVSPVI